MKIRYVKTDARGRVAHAGEGLAFALFPARPPDADISEPVGRYPVRVQVRDGDSFDLHAPDVLDFGRRVGFRLQQIGPIAARLNGGAFEAVPMWWAVAEFSRPGEGLSLAPGRRVLTRAHGVGDLNAGASPPANSDTFPDIVYLSQHARRVAVAVFSEDDVLQVGVFFRDGSREVLSVVGGAATLPTEAKDEDAASWANIDTIAMTGGEITIRTYEVPPGATAFGITKTSGAGTGIINSIVVEEVF